MKKLAALLLLAACGTGDKPEQTQLAASFAKPVLGLFHREKAADAPDLTQLAATALAETQEPVVLMVLEATNTPIIGTLAGENGAMRSYLTKDEKAIILRDGLLVGTRGFGYDLMSAETEAVATLLRQRAAGQAEHKARYLDGEGIERPVPLACTVSAGARVEQASGESKIGLTPMTEQCQFRALQVTNSYYVSDAGAVVTSRQWLGAELGYVTLTHLRN